MEVIVREDSIMRNAINLVDSDYEMPKFIVSQLERHKTSLGDNPCFPIEQKYPFDYSVIYARYKEVISELNKLPEANGLNLDDIKTLCNKYIQKCVDIEKNSRDSLSIICKKAVQKILCVPDDIVIVNSVIVDEVKPKKAPRIMPEDDEEQSYEFEDVDDMTFSNNAVLKRRFVNSLVQGASYIESIKYDVFASDIDSIDARLIPLYRKIDILSNYILFNDEEKINEKNFSHGSYVEVTLGKKDEKTIIDAQGIIFPYLLRETIRGFFELFASHGLPQNNKKAMYLIRHADFVMAESWDLRFGVKLWEMISDGLDDELIVPHFFAEIAKLPVSEFNSEVKEMLVNTRHGKKYRTELINLCKRRITFADVPNNYSSDENIKTIISDDTSQEEGLTIEDLKKMNMTLS